MAITHVWMRHTVHGGQAQFPEASVPQWQVLGWEPCDPPAEPDPRQDPRYVDLPPEDPKPAPAKPAASKTPVAKPSGDPKKEKADG
jgi:hypothetical protein